MSRLKFVFAAAIVLCTAGSLFAISFGGPGGEWPKTWPKELEPLRKTAWTWEHGFGGTSFDIPFATREEFEAAWPHILKLRSKDAKITLVRGAHLRVGKEGKSAGVLLAPPREVTREEAEKLPANIISTIRLVVDGEIVDLNRIPLPADTAIIDERFKDEKKVGRRSAAGLNGEKHNEPTNCLASRSRPVRGRLRPCTL